VTYFHYVDEGDGLAYLKGHYNLIKIVKKGKKVSAAYAHQGLPKLVSKLVLLTPNGKKKELTF
jgi:hypothetical protein